MFAAILGLERLERQRVELGRALARGIHGQACGQPMGLAAQAVEQRQTLNGGIARLAT